MIIYHGSDIPVSNPKILSSNRLLDFGEGFYTTSSLEQAKRWAWRVSEKRKTKEQIISEYEFNISLAEKELKIINFNTPDSNWLHFVVACRSGREAEFEYDIAIGPVANDNVYATVQLYETGLLTEAETIVRLKVEQIYDQILFHTERALALLKFAYHYNAGEKPVG